MVTHGRQSKHLSDLGISTILRSPPSNGVFHTQVVLVTFSFRLPPTQHAQEGDWVPYLPSALPKKKIRGLLEEKWNHVHWSARAGYGQRLKRWPTRRLRAIGENDHAP